MIPRIEGDETQAPAAPAAAPRKRMTPEQAIRGFHDLAEKVTALDSEADDHVYADKLAEADRRWQRLQKESPEGFERYTNGERPPARVVTTTGGDDVAAEPEKAPSSIGEMAQTFGEQAGNALTFDFADEGASQLRRLLPDPEDPEGIPREYAAGSAQEDFRRQTEREQGERAVNNPGSAITGRIAGSALSYGIPGAGASKLIQAANVGRGTRMALGTAAAVTGAGLGAEAGAAGRAQPGEWTGGPIGEAAMGEMGRPDAFNPMLIGSMGPLVASLRQAKAAPRALERAEVLDEYADMSRLSAGGARDYQLNNLREGFGKDYLRGIAKDTESAGFHLDGSGPGGLSSSRDIGRKATAALESATENLKGVQAEAVASGASSPHGDTARYLRQQASELEDLFSTTGEASYARKAQTLRAQAARLTTPDVRRVPGRPPGRDESIAAEVVDDADLPWNQGAEGAQLDRAVQRVGGAEPRLPSGDAPLSTASREMPRGAPQGPRVVEAQSGRGERYTPDEGLPGGTVRTQRAPRTWAELVEARKRYDDDAFAALKANKDDRAKQARKMASHYRELMMSALESVDPALRDKLKKANRAYEVARYNVEFSDSMSTRVRVPHEMNARDLAETALPAVYGAARGSAIPGISAVRRMLNSKSADAVREFGLDKASRAARSESTRLRSYAAKPPSGATRSTAGAGAVGSGLSTRDRLRAEIARREAQENQP